MRYNTPVYFQKVVSGDYNPDTANYAEDAVTEVKRYASVTDTGDELCKLIYNEIKQGSLIIRLQRPYKDKFDFIRIGKKFYKVSVPKRQKVFIVKEVQRGKN